MARGCSMTAATPKGRVAPVDLCGEQGHHLEVYLPRPAVPPTTMRRLSWSLAAYSTRPLDSACVRALLAVCV